ncbi:conserved membrane hypothetical protein [uncultured Sporomusa sp.]|uniref:DUF3100 domain-containing protein n=1 Tax=uncultured Sporomusa sp. TaxID=307249 RepID=A0A212LUT9_9FIRM|nr:DUF3100 domain-containing protein [uncultured Sporomusa sp.]SCM81394.1 conserved membrane hypothetical protein [uncultured Sporomusa sp.]
MLIKNWKLNLLALILVIIAELIGEKKFKLGPGFLLFLPMLYALIMGAIVSWPKTKIMSLKDMDTANVIMGSAVMLFVSKIGALIGPALGQVAQSGLALSLQELGHFFGTILFGLPIAILLGLRREAVGATFSIDREPNIAIIAEKYGMDSPEGRGVMATYICGTLFGAVYLGLVAGYIASLNIFHPIALAMGAGVGSGSMMAAASGAIAAAYPEQAKEVATYAAAANLLTTVIGVYFALFISLPMANKIYAWMTAKIDKKEVADNEKMG